MQAGGRRSRPRYTRSDRHGLSCFPLPPSKQKLSLLHLSIYFGWRKRRAMCSDGGGGEGSIVAPTPCWMEPGHHAGCTLNGCCLEAEDRTRRGWLGHTVLTQSSSWVSWTMRCRTSTSPSLWGRQEVIHAPTGAGSASRASPFLLPTLGEDVVLQGPPLCFQGGWLMFPTNPGLG